ncbi:hypothetical protein ABTY20_01475 [Streptomyces sp. NPDC126497]|uniref:hypothetical protein n=1 Tax=Streptomyces sp. NPDC126497 TaxID=3155313 RepID=UPI00331DD1AD
MGRQKAHWPGGAALALLIAVTAAGCGGPGDGAGGSAGAAHSAPPSSPSPRAVSGAESCASAVGYWARAMLDGREPYGDYQSMGLSNRQYDILREVVEAARATEREHGARAAGESVDRRVRQACAERYRDGGPRHGPWHS